MLMKISVARVIQVAAVKRVCNEVCSEVELAQDLHGTDGVKNPFPASATSFKVLNPPRLRAVETSQTSQKLTSSAAM